MRAISSHLARLILPFCLLALLGLQGCVPTSEEPIVVPGQPVSDSRLLGVWYGPFDEDDDPVYLHFLAADPNRAENHPGGMDILMVMQPREADDDAGWGILYALTAEVAGRSYLSIEYRVSDGEEVEELRGYHLFRYEIHENGTLQLLGVNEDLLEELIESGAVEGDVDDGGFITDIRVTASTEDLVTFLKTDDAGPLFSESLGPFRPMTLR